MIRWNIGRFDGKDEKTYWRKKNAIDRSNKMQAKAIGMVGMESLGMSKVKDHGAFCLPGSAGLKAWIPF
jgi:hypothetical protein